MKWHPNPRLDMRHSSTFAPAPRIHVTGTQLGSGDGSDSRVQRGRSEPALFGAFRRGRPLRTGLRMGPFAIACDFSPTHKP